MDGTFVVCYEIALFFSTRGARFVAVSRRFAEDLVTKEYWRGFLHSLNQELKTSWKSLRHISKRIGWKRIWMIVGFHTLGITFIVSSLISLLGWEAGFDPNTCLPDGRFSIESGFDSWAITNAFQISMGFGALDFSQAKLLDVAWDLVVGRGGQGALAFVAYIVTTKSFVMSMENSSVPLPTFEAVTLQDGTVISFWKQLCGFLSFKSTKYRLSLLWILLSTLFIVSFPTLAASITGYAPVTEPFLRDHDGQLQPLTRYRMVRYIVHDADRLGLPAPLELTTIPRNETLSKSLSEILINDICASPSNVPFRYSETNGTIVPAEMDSIDEECRMAAHVIKYLAECGHIGSAVENVSSTFNGTGEVKKLSPPLLNIEAFDLSPLVPNPGATWGLGYTTRWGSNYDYPSPTRYRLKLPDSNITLDQNDLDPMGACQQTAKYQFGFSFLLLFVVLILFIIWLLGTYCMFLDTFLNSKLDIAKRDMGIYRAALDVSSVFDTDVKGGIVDSSTPNQMLKKRLRHGKEKATIGYQSFCDTLPPATRKALALAWGRTGGYRRWIPRVTFSLLLMLPLLITPVFSTIAIANSQAAFEAGISILIILLVINILVLGNEKQRNQWRKTANHLPPQQPLTLAEATHSAGLL